MTIVNMWIFPSLSQLSLTGAVLSLDGTQCLKESLTAQIPDWSPATGGPGSMSISSIFVQKEMHEAVVAAEELGTKLAETLLSQGAKDILLAAQEENSLWRVELLKYSTRQITSV